MMIEQLALGYTEFFESTIDMMTRIQGHLSFLSHCIKDLFDKKSEGLQKVRC